MMLLLAAAGVSAGNSITREGDVIRLRAGVIEKTIRISGGAVLSDSLTVAGIPLLDAKSEELSFQISRAAPNRNPLELHSDSGAAALSVAETKAGGTDALAVNAGGKSDPKGVAPGVKWVDVRSFSASRWAPCFELSKVTAFSPKPGVQRLHIRTRALKDPVLAGVSINQIYETYDGFPVIRKWVEIHNNGANWLKLDNLRIDGMRLKPEICNQTMLTPSERGAVASVIAFSHTDKTKGVIVASEVPSALRDIDAGGASGYNAEHFEWVLGPAEGFTSEQVFIYGFAGEVLKTPSAESLPMDRTVEDGFKQFLREQLGISPDHLQIPAPLWCSWSNFGPKLTDAIVREQADIAAKCGFAVMQLDDGWQKGRLGTTPDPKTFTDFRATCDYILSKGLRIGLWVSTFRDPDAPDFQTLPDAASAPAVTRLGGVAMSFASAWRQYYARDLVSLRDIYDVTYFKQDFTNIRFGDLAAGHDSRTRKESLLRGLRGLLESQALLRRLAPDVANEITHEIYWGTPGTPCDLAALKNASLYHVPPNDYSGCGHAKQRPGASAAWNKYKPDNLRAELVKGCLNARNQLYAHRGLPLECVEYFGAATVNWKGSLTPQVQDRQVCSWLMGSPAVYTGDLASLTQENIARYRNRFDILKRLEKTYGIYRHFQYSGVPTPTDTGWHWWGKLDKRGCGAVVVLRGSQGTNNCSVNIPWVDPAKTYAVAALFQNQHLGLFTGAQLREGKLNLALPPLGQEILELSPEYKPEELRPIEDVKGLPRVLLIGDSISMGYTLDVRRLLEGKANVHRIPTNGGPTTTGLAELDEWLGKGKWDFIHFNWGLHDLKYMAPDGKNFADPNAATSHQQVPPDQYEKNLRELVGRLKKTGARLIWATTTPVPAGADGRVKGDAAKYNAIALKIMTDNGVAIDDLYALALPQLTKIQQPRNVHFTADGYKVLAGQVAESILKGLESSAQTPKKNLPIKGEVFTVEGQTAFLILPEKTRPRNPIPWVWYAPTLSGLPGEYEKWMFEKFLDNGIAIAGVDVGESYGSPNGTAIYSALYKELVEKRGLAKQACLLARSRGGLMLYNWAAENPASVACIAGIYPVSNLSSYPGLGRACAAYGMTEVQLSEKLTEYNPIDRLAPLARAKVPIFHIHGDSDTVVPLDKNSGELKKRYDKLGGEMTLEIVKGQGHNLWPGWFHSQKLVEFVITHTQDTIGPRSLLVSPQQT